MGTPPTFPNNSTPGQADLQFILDPPRAQAFQATTPVALADDVNTLLTFDTIMYDSDTMWNGGTPSRLTVKTPGLYYCQAMVRVPTAVYGNLSINPRMNAGGVASSGTSIVTHSHINTTIVPGTSGSLTANVSLSARIAFELVFAVNDYVEVFVRQKSGATRNTDNGSGGNVCGLSMRWVAYA